MRHGIVMDDEQFDALQTFIVAEATARVMGLHSDPVERGRAQDAANLASLNAREMLCRGKRYRR